MANSCPRCKKNGFRDYEGFWCPDHGTFGEVEHFVKPMADGTIMPCPECHLKFKYRKRLRTHMAVFHPDVAA